ncbi:hypothetical protein lerEdw1_011311 [Lerista edwardsae]|nr:hypothetical protein lerEdw1_011311 [Lerista edwardsae]
MGFEAAMIPLASQLHLRQRSQPSRQAKEKRVNGNQKHNGKGAWENFRPTHASSHSSPGLQRHLLEGKSRHERFGWFSNLAVLFHIHISHLYMDYEEDDDTSFAKWMSSFWGHNVADENERERRAYRKWQTRSIGERRASLPVRLQVKEYEEEGENGCAARKVLEGKKTI